MLVLKIRKRVFGQEYPDTLRNIGQLSAYMQDPGLVEGGGGASRHADEHGQPGVNVPEPWPAEGGREAAGAGDEDQEAGARRGAWPA